MEETLSESESDSSELEPSAEDSNYDTDEDQMLTTHDDGLAPSADGTSSTDSVVVDQSVNGTTDSVMPHNRGNSRFRLVLWPLCDNECSKCEYDHSGQPKFAPNSKSLPSFTLGQPVCRLPSPFLNYSQLPSGYCADTISDCTEIEKRARPGLVFCEVKGQSTVLSYTRESADVSTATKSSLSCPIDDTTSHSRCLKRLQEELRLAEQRRVSQKEKMMKRERDRRESKEATTVNPEKQEKPVPEMLLSEKLEKLVSEKLVTRNSGRPSTETPTGAKFAETNFATTRVKESEYSVVFRNLEFLPYHPLPVELDEVVFPERSRPLEIFDDPYWPNKASCVRLVEKLGSADSGVSTYTGTYLSPNAKGTKLVCVCVCVCVCACV